jgi:glycosyltransferase involved in cell wall biosynthesis
MRICILNEFFYPDSTGGTGSILTDVVRKLVNNHDDLSIDVITSRHLYRIKDANLAREEDWEGVRITRLNTPYPRQKSLPLRLFANISYSVASFVALMRRERYDLLLVATAPPTTPLVAHLYKRLYKIPYIYLIYDLEPDRSVSMGVLKEKSLLVKMIRRAQKTWLHSAKQVVVIGRCMNDRMSKEYDLPCNSTSVIPTGFDPDIVSPQKNSHFRTVHSLSGYVVLYAGNFGLYHNFDTILDAAKRMQQMNSSVTFVFVGDGAQKEHIVERISNEELKNVLMFPYVPSDQYADLLAAADVCMVTLEPGMEGLCVPSKFYSILAAGRPTIAMIHPDSEVSRVVEEEDCGVRVDPCDSEGMVNAIMRLASSPDDSRRMGHNARRALENNYTVSLAADHFHQLFVNNNEDMSSDSDSRSFASTLNNTRL